MDFVPKLSPRLRKPTHLRPLVEGFERAAASPGSVKQCYSVGVRAGKTTLIHHAIAWLLARNPEERILYLTYAYKFGARQTAKAKELAIRAGVAVKGRSSAEWYTRSGGLVKAAGIGGQLTGEGFTRIIIDDPHKNRAEAESRIVREGVVEAVFSDVLTRQDPQGTDVFVIHARWVPNDLIGVLSRSGGFQYDNLPWLDDRGRSLAPWLFRAKRLKEIFAMMGPYVTASLYQGDPRPRGGTLFGSPTLARPTEPESYQIAIGIDLARSSSERQDHNAAVVMRRDRESGIVDVLHAVRALGTITDRGTDDAVVDEGFVRQLVPLLHQYEGAQLVMYAAKSETALVQLLGREVSDAMGFDVDVHQLEIAGDKYLRAQPYAAAWNKGRVRLPGRSGVGDDHTESDDVDDGRDRDGWVSAFVAEHADFTGVRGGQDDWVDAGAAAYDHLVDGADKTGLAEAMSAVRRWT